MNAAWLQRLALYVSHVTTVRWQQRQKTTRLAGKGCDLFNSHVRPLFQVLFPPENFLPANKLKELEYNLRGKEEPDDGKNMDDDLYICANLEDCVPPRTRQRFRDLDEDLHYGGGVQCQTS